MSVTKIEWTATALPSGERLPGFSFNPWHGCVKVSQGCKFCYADAQDRRFGPSHWGPESGRKMMGDSYWRQPLRWNAEAAASGHRRKVFCASMADVFEQLPAEHPNRADQDAARFHLWKLVEATPCLDWLLLTKRPENVPEMVPLKWVDDGPAGWPSNAWVGTSVEDQKAADERIPHLIRVPAAVRFLSVEPMLGPVDLTRIGECVAWDGQGRVHLDALHGGIWKEKRGGGWTERTPGKGVDWVIVGGESGPGARPFDVAWARSVVAQCKAANVPVFVKQLGAVPVMDEAEWQALSPAPMLRAANHAKAQAGTVPLLLHDRKGGDISEFPEDLQVREFPNV